MKKSIICFFLICCLIYPIRSEAWVFIIPPAWALGVSVALHVAAVAGAVWYAMDPAKTASVSSSGDISRPAKVEWIDLNLTPPNQEKAVTTQMPLSKVQEIAAKKDASGNLKYPNAYDAVNKSTADPINKNSKVGDAVMVKNGKTYTIKSVTVQQYGSNNPADASYSSQDTNMAVFCMGLDSWSPGYMASKVFTWADPPVVVTPRLRTPSEFKSYVAPTSNAVASTSLQAELDKMFQDPSYTPVFTDDSTGLPYSPPPGAASQAQIDAYNAAGVAKEAAAASTAAANSAVTASQAARDQAASNSAANPGDAGLKQKLADAESDLAKAKANASNGTAAASTAAADAAAATAAAAGGTAAANKYDGYSDSDKPVKSDIKQLITDFINASPLTSFIKKLAVTTSASSSLLSFVYRGSTIPIEFARYSSVLSLAGAAMLGLSHMFALYIIFRGGSA